MVILWAPVGVGFAATWVYGLPAMASVGVGLFLLEWMISGNVAFSSVTAAAHLLSVGAAILYLRHRSSFTGQFRTTQGAIVFVAAAATFAPAIGATFASTGLVAMDWLSLRDFSSLALCWWAGDAIGMLTVAPALLLARRLRFDPVNNTSPVRALILVGLMAGVVGLVFSDAVRSTEAMAPILPLLLASAMRLGLPFTSLLVLALTMGAGAATALGHGPFVRATPTENLLYLFWFLSTVAIATLVLGALATQFRDAQRRLSGIIESSPGVIYQWLIETNGNHRFTFVSARIRDLFGIEPSELLSGRRPFQIHEDDLARWRDSIRLAASNAEDWIFRGRHVSPNGDIRWFDARANCFANDDGSMLYNGMLVDISKERAAEASRQLSARIIEASSDAIMVTDHADRIISVNPAFERVTGYSSDDILGKTSDVLCGEPAANATWRDLDAALGRGESWIGEMLSRRKDGTTFEESRAAFVLHDETGEATHRVSMFSDVTEAKAAEAKVRHMAHHDFLTNLPNRVLLEDRMQQGLNAAKRARERLAVMFIDLDRFKLVNDTFGHAIGDALLISVARDIEPCLRKTDTVCRQGGDEFIVLLSGIEAPQDAEKVAEKLSAAIGRERIIDGIDVSVSSSIGIALYPDDGDSVSVLLKHADTAMYSAKAAGRSTYRFFSNSMHVETRHRRDLETKLRRALEADQLLLHYQPQCQLSDGSLIGCEALVRWNAGPHGFIPPSLFIPLAEESGLINRIGGWVLNEACRQQREWLEAGLPMTPVAVNVSAVQFRQSSFVESVFHALDENRLDPAWLELEITEGVLVEDADASRRILNRLRDRGIALALDDFGTGYSSLGYLKRFPIQKLKIDQSFIRDLTTDANDAAIVTAISALGRSLGLKVIAEGVETAEQCDFLVKNGCDLIQGYWYSRPLAREPMRAYLASQSATPPVQR